MADGVISRVIDQIDEDFSDCTYIFLCAPVSSNAKYLEQLKPLIGPDCIITDVGSTKTDIHEKVTDLDMEANFIGGHPWQVLRRPAMPIPSGFSLKMHIT